VLARIPPLELLVWERAELYLAKQKKQMTTRIKEKRTRARIREMLLQRWEHRLSQTSNGEWTRRLVHNLRQWLSRSHGLMNFHLTQVMSGHGCFNGYLHRMRIVASPACSHCDVGRNDGANHTLFECQAWRSERASATQSLQRLGEAELTTDNMVDIMLHSEAAWSCVSTFACSVMRSKMDEEWRRQRGNQRTLEGTPIPE